MHTFAGLVWIQVTPVKWVVCTRAIKIPKMDPIPLEGPNAVNWSSKKRECTTNDFHSLIQHSEAWLLVLFFHPQLIWVKRKWKTCSKDHWQTRKVKGVDLRILHPIPRFTKHKAICNKHTLLETRILLWVIIFSVRSSQNTQKICYFSVGIKKYPQKYQKTDRIIELFFCACRYTQKNNKHPQRNRNYSVGFV